MSTKRSVYKKNSPNNKLVVYLVARDIFDDLQQVDPIEGVVTIDKNNIKNTNVYARIRCTFRYGEQELDEVLSGVTFFKEFYIQTIQIYPCEKDKTIELGDTAKRLVERFGKDALPFNFTLPHDIPASITLQSEKHTTTEANPCGIEYVLQIFSGDNPQGTAGKRNSISLAIRRLTLAVPKPNAEVHMRELVKSFHIHSGQLTVNVTLPKEIFFHGESIPVTISIENLSSNTVRRMKIQIVQTVEITLFKQRTTRCVISELEVEKGFPIESQTKGWSNTYQIRPSLQDVRSQPGLALDGKLKHQDTNLASSTLIKDFRKKEAMGIVVQYIIKIKVVTGFGGRDVQLEVPFILCHPRKEQELVKVELPSELVIEKFKRPKAKARGESEDQES